MTIGEHYWIEATLDGGLPSGITVEGCAKTDAGACAAAAGGAAGAAVLGFAKGRAIGSPIEMSSGAKGTAGVADSSARDTPNMPPTRLAVMHRAACHDWPRAVIGNGCTSRAFLCPARRRIVAAGSECEAVYGIVRAPRTRLATVATVQKNHRVSRSDSIV